MAAPVDSARQGTNITTAGTSHAINVGSPAAGTLLIVLVRFAASAGTVAFSGYSLIFADTSDASDDRTDVWCRLADGTEGATDTLTTTNSVKLAAICWEITGAEDPNISQPEYNTSAVGTTAANGADPGSAAPFGPPADTLYLAMMGLDGEGNAPTVAPSSYSNLTTANSGTGGSAATNCSIGGASRQISSSSSEDAGNFTHGAATTGWTAFTISVRPPGGFSFPTDAARAVTDTGGSNTTTPAFTTPSGIVAGQLLLLAWRAGGAVAAITDNAGFTQLVLSSADGTDDDYYVGYKVADGTEGASVVFTVTSGRRFAGVMHRIEDGGTPTIGTVGVGSGTLVNPALYDPAATSPGLWLAIGSTEGPVTVSSFPDDFSNGAQENVSTGTEGASIMAASRQLAVSKLNPGGFTISVNSNGHMHAIVFVPYEADAAAPSTFKPSVVLL